MENVERTDESVQEQMTLESHVDRLESGMADLLQRARRLANVMGATGSAMSAGTREDDERDADSEARSRAQKAILFNLNESAKTAWTARAHALDALAIVATIETHHDKGLWANPADDLRELREHLNEIQWRCDAVASDTKRAAEGQP